MNINITPEQKIKIYRAVKIVLIVFVILIGTKFLTHSSYGRNGDRPENTISFSGHGEVNAVPDMASIYFSISKEAKTVKEAQAQVALVEKSSLDVLKANNVLEKDIKTSNASFSPKYEYKYEKTVSPCNEYNCPMPGKSVIVGYTASESITVKVRNTDDVGKIMQGLGTVGVSDLSGPNFSIDNEDGLKAQARKKAIDDAKEKAKVLAKDLGVRLGKITSFSESGNYPMPMYTNTMMAKGASDEAAQAALPKGENTITSDITITYEIK